jgi:hypothetical protein
MVFVNRGEKKMGERWKDVVIVITLVSLIVANAWMIGREMGLFVAPRPKSWLEVVAEELWREQLKCDPPLGIEVAALKVFKGRRVVIVMERCTDCIAGTLKRWAEVVKEARLPKLVLVTSDSKEQAQQVLKRWQIEANIVTDPKGVIIQKLHAFFMPRTYAFKEGRLIWKQDKIRVDAEEVIKEVMKQ